MPRDKELPRRGAQRTPLPDPVEEEEELHQPPEDYEFELEHYTADCFVDIDVMLAYYASLARGTFTDDMGRDCDGNSANKFLLRTACTRS